jgi:hypothetical protein
MKKLIKKYDELITKACELNKAIIADEENLMHSEFEIEKSALFDLHALPNKENISEKRTAKNEDERRVVRKGLQLLPEHEEKRLALKNTKLLLDETMLRMKLCEREIAYALRGGWMK